jgi:hypothetical protein
MDFREPNQDFEDVDRKYAHLKELHATGKITDEEFAKQRKSLMVQDQNGRWWIKSRTSGEWHYHDGSAWVKGVPPRAQSTSWFNQEASKKPAEVEFKAPQQQASSIGVLAQPPSAQVEQRQAERAQKAKTSRPSLPSVLTRLPLTRGMLLALLLLGLVGVAAFAVALRVGVWSTAPESSAPTAPPSSPPPSPSRSVVFKDDFSSTSSGWPRNKDQYGGSSDYDTSRGIYNITPAAGKLHYATISKVGNLEDANVEVDATRTDEAPKTANWGVVCRQSLNSNNNTNGYSLAIQSDGLPAIWKVKDGVSSLINDPKTSTKVTDPSATNHIRGDCVGNKLTLYVNDLKLAEASDEEFTSGEVGLYAGSPGSLGSDVVFDNFSVGKP